MKELVKEFWLEEYRGQYSTKQNPGLATSAPTSATSAKKEKAFAAVKSHKRLKLRHEVLTTEAPAIDLLDQFLETDVVRLDEDECFDVIQYWNDRY